MWRQGVRMPTDEMRANNLQWPLNSVGWIRNNNLSECLHIAAKWAWRSEWKIDTQIFKFISVDALFSFHHHSTRKLNQIKQHAVSRVTNNGKEQQSELKAVIFDINDFCSFFICRICIASRNPLRISEEPQTWWWLSNRKCVWPIAVCVNVKNRTNDRNKANKKMKASWTT